MPASAQVGALESDCANSGNRPDRRYQFVATCPGKAFSPDGTMAVVQQAYQERQPTIELQDARGKVLDTLPGISDDMPFAVFWSPDSRWFFVNHHVGSFMDVLRIYRIVGQKAVERPELVEAAIRTARRRYPCLPAGSVLPNGARWSSDSRRVVLVTISRPGACAETHDARQFLWMIGNVTTGLIDQTTVHVQSDGAPFTIPRTPVYDRVR